MPSRPSLIDLLLTNPHGWGNQPPRQQQPAYQDDAGNSYGFDGSMLDRWRTPQEQPQYNPSLTDSLVNIATSPAKLAYGMVAEPYNALARLGDNFVSDDGSLGLPNPQNPENQTDMATLLMTGFGSNAFRGGRSGVVSSGPVVGAEKAAADLPMDHASRMARARGMGFDTDNVWYNGSAFRPDAYSLDHANTHFPNAGKVRAVWFSNSEKRARSYAIDHARHHNRTNTRQEPAGFWGKLTGKTKSVMDGPRAPGAVTEAHIRPGKQVALDMDDINNRENLFQFIAQARDGGADTVLLKRHRDAPEIIDGKEVYLDELIVFNPTDVRSVDAVFDPANASKNGLLLSDTGRPSLLGSALAAENANYLDRFRY